MIKRYKNAKIRRKLRVRAKVRGTAAKPRLSVFRSNKAIYAQLIDDAKGQTLVAVSEKELAKKSESGGGTKTERARLLGNRLAQKAVKKGIKTVGFDRGAYRYHGRVKALAEGAREGGLKL